jgi:hypothetical protein
VTVLQQHLTIHGALVPTKPVARSRFIYYLDDPLAYGTEFFLNHWEEEILDTVNRIRISCAFENPWYRFEKLKWALSWLWPNLRETAIMAQFTLETTIDNTSFMTMLIGWNDGADPNETEIMDEFVPLFVERLEKLGHPCKYLSSPEIENKVGVKRPNAGPRLDTLKKLQDLVVYRRGKRTSTLVTINRMQACEEVGLALATVKKHAPTLYERWYEAAYEGDVH